MPMSASQVRRFRAQQREIPRGVSPDDERRGFRPTPSFEPKRPQRRRGDELPSSPPLTAKEAGGKTDTDETIEVGPDMQVRRRKRS